jgi:SNF2 family DNA or RNA helicase
MSVAFSLLRPFQQKGVEFLRNRRFAYLADEMGLGKTAQLATAAAGHKRILTISPAVAVPQWRAALQRFATPCLTSYDGQPCSMPVISSLSYNALQRSDTLSRTRSERWDILIVDEAHNLQSTTSARSKHVLGEAGLVHSAEKVWFASGTPAPRGDPRQLWPILFVTGQTRLDFRSFTATFCDLKHSIRKYGSRSFEHEELIGVKNKDELNAMLAPFMLRRTAKDVMPELPPIAVETVPLEVEDVSTEWLCRHFPDRIDSDTDALVSMFKLGEAMLVDALKQPGGFEPVMDALLQRYEVKSILHLLGLQKAKAVAPLVVEELARGEYQRIGLICVHRSAAEELYKAINDAGMAAAIISGDVPVARRHEQVQRFRAGRIRAIILQIHAAGTALDGLQCCNRVGLIEKTWIPGLNEQAIKRFHRFGSDRPVFVRDFYAAGTIDARLNSVLSRRIGFNDALFGY